MEKEFGLYDRDDLRSLLKLFNGIIAEGRELPRVLSGKITKVVPDDFYWLPLWDKSFIEQVAIQTSLFMNDEQRAAVTSSDNPQQEIIGLVERDQGVDPPEELRPFALASTLAIFRTFNAIRYYGYPLNEYVSAYKNNRNDDILFKVLRIDKSFAGHEEVRYRLAIADAEGDERFFTSFAKAIVGQPHKSLLEYCDLRLLLTALADTQTKLTQEAAYELFCEDLGVYPHGGGDAALNLWQFIKRWEADRPT